MKTNDDALPLVSVAMVAYRQAHLIECAIKGVARQKAPFRIELIVVDDCSPDDTYEVAKRMQRRYPDIVRAFRNESNIGLQRNYLRAFGRCRGKYLALCDADDYWCDHSKLRRQVEYMEAHPECAVTFHRVINHYAGTGVKSLSNPRQKTDCGIAELSRENFITNCSVVYRRELVDLKSLPAWISKDVWPDYPVHMLYAAKGDIHYFSRPMAVYRQGGKGAWTTAGEYGRQSKALNVRRHLLEEFAGRTEAEEGLKMAVRNILVVMTTCAPNEAERQKAIAELKASYGLSEEQINDLAESRKQRRSPLQRILTGGRKFVSLFIPLPRP